jgi:hypothetical protein
MCGPLPEAGRLAFNEMQHFPAARLTGPPVGTNVS